MGKLIVLIALLLVVGATAFGVGGAKKVQAVEAELSDLCITNYQCDF
jgi:hypothetical protein